MNPIEQWQQANTEYLAAAVAWLRLCLVHRASQHRLPPMSSPVTASAPEGHSSFWDRFRHKPASALPYNPRLLLTQGREISEDEHVAQAAAHVTSLESQASPPALVALCQRLGLSRFEQEILLLCAAMELDTGIAGLCARAHDDPGKAHPTFALALSLFEGAAWEALSPDRPLRFWRLIEINQPGAQALTTSALRIDERIMNYIKGLNHLDDRLAHLLSPLATGPSVAPLPASQEQAAQKIVQRLQHTEPSTGIPVAHLTGSDSASKQLVAVRAASLFGLKLFRLGADQLPQHGGDLEMLSQLWFRESLLLPVALYLDAHDFPGGAPAEAQLSLLHRFLMRTSGIVFLDTRDALPGLPFATMPLDVGKPTPAEQRTVWNATLSEAGLNCGAKLAEQFHLDLATIQKIARTVTDTSTEDPRPLPERVWDECLAYTRPRLENLAQRLEPKASWDDIVLPPNEIALLRQLARQVGNRTTVYEDWGFRDHMNRGLGISALFAGESGTGKTMAGEVIANDLRLNLYRIDLSAVVSKYIGETEKNLRRLFDAAEDGGAILFFDEADALFGKRSEVKDSHDRYANIEINYLLQRMESYRGLAILATNMKGALDTAFLRRLRFIVNFPFPGPAERKAIWQKVFPHSTPLADIDFDRLARLVLTGGSIRNIAINAAFQAAGEGTPIRMPVLLDAARAEFRKLERPVSEADLRWTAPATPAPQAAAGAAA